MGKYGETALQAVKMVQNGSAEDPISAWNQAAFRMFPNSKASQEKGCPKGAFLGLCQERKVKGIPAGSYTRSNLNKVYAVQALNILCTSSKRPSERELWAKLQDNDPSKKQYNQQMDVVLTLHDKGLLLP